MDCKISFLAFFFFCARFSPAFPTADRLRGFALRPHCVNTTSRWQDSNLWPSVPKTDALTRLRYTSSPPQNIWIYPIDKEKNRSAVAHPALGTGRREPPLLGKKPTIWFSSRFTCILFRSVSFWEWNRTTHSVWISSPKGPASERGFTVPRSLPEPFSCLIFIRFFEQLARKPLRVSASVFLLDFYTIFWSDLSN